MKRILTSVLLAALGLSAISQDVAQWRGPKRNGIYNEPGLMKKWPDPGPKLLWHFDGLGEGHTSAAVTSAGIFTTGMVNGTGYIYALDHSGKLKWKQEYGKEWNESHVGVRSTPLVIKDKLYFMSAYGMLFCMSTTDGKLIWSLDTFKEYGGRNITWGVTENLLYDGNVLYCSPGGPDASVIALDRNNGKLIWKSKGNSEKSAYCSPVLIQLPSRKLLVTMMESSIHGIDAATGRLLWKFGHTVKPFVHPNVPVYIDGYLYCTTGYGLGGVMLEVAPDGTSVKEVWKNVVPDPKVGGFVVLDGKIFGTGDRNRSLFCLDWKTGKVLYSLKDLAPGNIISNDGYLYIYSEAGKVALVKPQSDKFDILSSFSVPMGAGPHWAHLVINNKKLFVRHGSALMVYDIAAAKL